MFYRNLARIIMLASLIGFAIIGNARSETFTFPGQFFGDVVVGTKSTLSLSFKNTGTTSEACTPLTASIAGTNTTEFSASHICPGSTIEPGESQTVSFVFSPQSTGAKSATANFTDATGDVGAFPLSGNGVTTASPAANMTGSWVEDASSNGALMSAITSSFSGVTGAKLTLNLTQNGNFISGTGIEEVSTSTCTAVANMNVSGTANGNQLSLTIQLISVTGCTGTTTQVNQSFGVTAVVAGNTMGFNTICQASGSCSAAGDVFTRGSTATNPTLAVSRSGSGEGTISSSPTGIACGTDCWEDYAPGASVTLTATPSAGSIFTGWSGDCSGTGSCVVTMSSAKNVTATFKPAPFVATTSGTVSGARAVLTSTITFNSSDTGKQGSVYATAWVPVSGLDALGISAAASSALKVTSTKENPYTTRNVQTMIAPLAAADGNSFVLVQMTSSGWKLVVNGQLIAYSSGVLGEQQAALTLLNNTNVSNLVGAQFCVGYGSSEYEMIMAGRMLPVATITSSSTISNSASGNCNVAASAPAARFTGLWWNANESGWGMSLTQQDSMIFVAWFTYDAAGKPVWLVMSSCPLVGSSCTGDIYEVKGGTQLGVPWNGAGKVVTKVGAGTLSFTGDDAGTFAYTVNGVSGSRNMTRQPIASGTSKPVFDYSALYWNADESGWGVALTQQYGTIFATMYSYDASGNPVWYVASSCAISNNGCSGALYQVAGGVAPTATWNGAKVAVTEVGSVSFSFNDSSIGTMSYSINGVSGTKAISRQLF
ncbi:MAG: hypothetical protein Q8O37_15440 [Sulfuricellaceae bacterium]|nr:hypothetical protein [Sulfuricellaceae bacterium]